MLWYAVKLKNKWYDFEHEYLANSLRPTCLCPSETRAKNRAKYIHGELIPIELTEKITTQLGDSDV